MTGRMVHNHDFSLVVLKVLEHGLNLFICAVIK